MQQLKNFFKGANHRPVSNSATLNNCQIDKPLTGNLSVDCLEIRNIFNPSSDIIYRELKIWDVYNSTVLFIDELVDTQLINSDLLKPLLIYGKNTTCEGQIQLSDLINYLQQSISVSNITTGTNCNEIIDHILSGETILLVEGINTALFIDVKKSEKRSISESIIEPVIRGPRDGFIEDIKTNTALLRKRIKTPKFKVEKMDVGRLSKTTVIVLYIEGIAKDALVQEVKKRISAIDIDAVLESEYIEEYIRDNRFSPFPQIGFTERPDRLTSSLFEGHVGIMVDNSPIALIAPFTFFQYMQSSEDYYQNYIPATMIRIIRYIFLFTALTLPAFYIALLNFHQGMIPKTLLTTIWASREGVPFPVFVEAMLLEVFFEALREAGIRLPSASGQTVSIVGALVIGEAAVRAGMVSSAMVIVVSITGISSFVIPRYNFALAIRVLRFYFIILAGTLGLYGMFAGGFILLTHMANLRSFGVPYLSPVAPMDFNSLKDVIIRAPIWSKKKRPGFIGNNNSYRSSDKSDSDSSK
jgi:hypothetical protein